MSAFTVHATPPNKRAPGKGGIPSLLLVGRARPACLSTIVSLRHAMNAFALTLIVLAIWWVAFSLLVARDKVRHAKEQSRSPQPEVPPDFVPSPQPRWPSWVAFRSRQQCS